MARISVIVGYGSQVETVPGVWSNTFVEKTLYGDLNKNTRRLENSNQLNNNINITNELSLVADAYAIQNFMFIKYVIINGIKWCVKDVTVNHPRLILGIGNLYNGQ